MERHDIVVWNWIIALDSNLTDMWFDNLISKFLKWDGEKISLKSIDIINIHRWLYLLRLKNIDLTSYISKIKDWELNWVNYHWYFQYEWSDYVIVSFKPNLRKKTTWWERDEDMFQWIDLSPNDSDIPNSVAWIIKDTANRLVDLFWSQTRI